MSTGIGGVVVTFNPTVADLENISNTRRQFDHFIVVDNGSPKQTLARLRAQSIEEDFLLIQNAVNLGIARALNQGIKELLIVNDEWILLLDQDSRLTPQFASKMVADFRAIAAKRKILQLVPRYIDPESSAEVHNTALHEDGGPFLTITSGSLYRAEVFGICGLFEEDLFVYCVDDDYSLRIRDRGYSIGKSQEAVLWHLSGHTTSRRFLGWTISTKNYRPASRYYFARNKIWILKHWARKYPRLILPTVRQFISIPAKILLAEDRRLEKLGMFGRGIVDGIKGVVGPLSQ